MTIMMAAIVRGHNVMCLGMFGANPRKIFWSVSTNGLMPSWGFMAIHTWKAGGVLWTY
jgi:hypothetical protein